MFGGILCVFPVFWILLVQPGKLGHSWIQPSASNLKPWHPNPFPEEDGRHAAYPSIPGHFNGLKGKSEPETLILTIKYRGFLYVFVFQLTQWFQYIAAILWIHWPIGCNCCKHLYAWLRSACKARTCETVGFISPVGSFTMLSALFALRGDLKITPSRWSQ
jgi:hypothetical protein